VSLRRRAWLAACGAALPARGLFAAVASAAAAPRAAAAAAVWVVGPQLPLAQALRRAGDGDTVEIPAGDWHGEVGVVTQRRLLLRGPGAVLHAAGRHAEGKAILVVRGGEVEVQGLGFRGCRVPSGNGAGIRLERGRLRLSACSFLDNEMGLLSSNEPTVALEIDDCRFGQAPRHDSGALHHLLYAGRIARLEVRRSHFSGGFRGHLLKSRAAVSRVEACELVDGPGGEASYELEFANGGDAEVQGCTIGQSAGTNNSALVAFGAEGAGDGGDAKRTHRLVMRDNTLINDGPPATEFVRVFREALGAPVALQLSGNRYVGPGRRPAGEG
jgi:hypothetical protein